MKTTTKKIKPSLLKPSRHKGRGGTAPLILNLSASSFIRGTEQRYRLTRRSVGSHKGPGRVGGDTKLIPLPGFEPRIAQSAVCNRPC
jgi:hypothetical protein